MALTSSTRSVDYVGNGATAAYALPFRWLADSDLLVTIAGVTKTLGVDYTLSGVGSALGGTISFTAAPANLAAVHAERRCPALQPTSFVSQGPFLPETHETAFDRLCMALQDAGSVVGVTSAPAANPFLTNGAPSGLTGYTNVAGLTSTLGFAYFDALTSSVPSALDLKHALTSGTAVNGIGVGLGFRVQNAGGGFATNPDALVVAQLTTAAVGTLTSALSFRVKTGGASGAVEMFKVASASVFSNSNVFDVNADASTVLTEDTSLRIQTGNAGGYRDRYTFKADSANGTIYVFHEHDTGSGYFGDWPNAFGIGDINQTVAGSPALWFYGGDGAAAQGASIQFVNTATKGLNYKVPVGYRHAFQAGNAIFLTAALATVAVNPNNLDVNADAAIATVEDASFRILSGAAGSRERYTLLAETAGLRSYIYQEHDTGSGYAMVSSSFGVGNPNQAVSPATTPFLYFYGSTGAAVSSAYLQYVPGSSLFNYNVPTGMQHNFMVNGTAQFTVGSASVAFNGQRITNIGAPSGGGDAVTKTYADSYAPTVICFGSSAAGADTTLRFLRPGYAELTADTTEVKMTSPIGGVLRNLRIRTVGAPATQGQTFFVRKNGSPTTMTALLAAAGTSASDLTHFPTVAAGDDLSVSVQGVSGITVGATFIIASFEITTV